MTDVVENGTEQPTEQPTPKGRGSLPPVETDDIRPKEGGEAKTDKSQDESQSPKGTKDAKGPGPWQQKLAERGLADPAFDEFLRTEVQPYITQLEQRGGGGQSQFWDGDVELEESAYQLVQAFRTDPVSAYRELGEILGLSEGMGDEGIEGDDLLGDDFDELGDEEGGSPADPRMEYLDNLMRREQEAAEDAEYKEFLDQLGQRVPGFDPDLYSVILAATPNGDLDIAWQTYMKFHREPTAPPNAPPQLGGPEGGTAPPEAPKFDSIGDALGAFLNEERAKKARA